MRLLRLWRMTSHKASCAPACTIIRPCGGLSRQKCLYELAQHAHSPPLETRMWASALLACRRNILYSRMPDTSTITEYPQNHEGTLPEAEAPISRTDKKAEKEASNSSNLTVKKESGVPGMRVGPRSLGGRTRARAAGTEGC